MSKFFERGNLALDWDYIKGDFVAVDAYGLAVSYYIEPQYEESEWMGLAARTIGYVGAHCPDWRELLFERPQAQRLPDGFWEAAKLAYGENAEWAAFSEESNVPTVVSEKPDIGISLGTGLRVWGLGLPKSIMWGVVIENVDYENSLTRRPFLRIGQTEADE